MDMINRFINQSNMKAIQIIQYIWLAFSVFCIGFAIPGISHFMILLRTPCNGESCFDAQLTYEIAQSWVAFGLKLQDYASLQVISLLIIDLLLIGTTAFLMWRKADNRSSVVAAFLGMAIATSTFSQAQAYVDPHFWFPAHLILYIQMAGLLPLFCLLPDGHFQPGWMRWIALVYALANLFYLLPDYQAWLVPGTISYLLWLAFTSASIIIVLATLTNRFRHANNLALQEQMLWVFASISLAALYIFAGKLLRLIHISNGPMDVVNFSPIFEFLVIFLAVGSFTCLLVALVNYEPFDFKLLVNRSIVYLSLTAFVVAVYGFIVGYLSSVFHSENVLFSLVATGLIAVLFQPLRERLQRFVNRMIYGERDDPYKVISQLGKRLETVIASDEVIPTVLRTVLESLKVSYVEISLYPKEGDVLSVAAADGQPSSIVLTLPLVYQNEKVGLLQLGPRARESSFSPADRRLLDGLARQAGAAIHAARLNADLQRARERLVVAQEEERRRIRRDLHDGLGASLAALNLQAGEVQRLMASDLDAANRRMADLRASLRAAVGDTRRLVYGLRPPALDELGLLEALRSRIAQYSAAPAAQSEDAASSGGLQICFAAPDNLPTLPAAVEVAVYRIVEEGLANIVHHAQASNGWIALSLEERGVYIEIRDDGIGLPDVYNHGVGLISMRERTAELGGKCTIQSTAGQGTKVEVWLPFIGGEKK
jgi:signal transduction histidine kinase